MLIDPKHRQMPLIARMLTPRTPHTSPLFVPHVLARLMPACPPTKKNDKFPSSFPHQLQLFLPHQHHSLLSTSPEPFSYFQPRLDFTSPSHHRIRGFRRNHQDSITTAIFRIYRHRDSLQQPRLVRYVCLRPNQPSAARHFPQACQAFASPPHHSSIPSTFHIYTRTKPRTRTLQ